MKKTTFVCAHRGASSTHPENTLPAFAETIRLDCAMVEFDVRATVDGALMILHDASVDRTTDGSGPMEQLSYEEVRRLDASAGHEAFSGTQIPTLNETLDALPGTIELNIHVYPGAEDGEFIVKSVCQEIRSRHLYARAFIAGSDDVMGLVMDTDADVRRCLLGSQNRPDTYAQLASEMGCSSVQPLNSITTKKFCDEAHRLGLIVHPFYADDETEMRRLIECGVDGILTNQPQRMIQFLESLS